MPSDLSLTVNGAVHAVSIAPDTPLLYVLRNELKLTGPRLGCGMAQCGACAVLVDGVEMRACITPAAALVGRRITTIEGLPAIWAEAQAARRSGHGAAAAAAAAADRGEGRGTAGDDTLPLHPVQQAWIDEQVPQCGYCQSGMMIAAVDLLSKQPDPTVAQIKEAFTNTLPSPHLCRCGTYAAIIDAVQRAARAMKA